MPSEVASDLDTALRAFRGPDGASLARLEPGEEPEPRERGSYALVIGLSAAHCLAAGRLAPSTLPAGRYIYCGSALGGLRARVARHLARSKMTARLRTAKLGTAKRKHWHVDYLLEVGKVAEVWVTRSSERLECLLAGNLASQPAGSLAIARFGASDCRCPGHLVRWTA